MFEIHFISNFSLHASDTHIFRFISMHPSLYTQTKKSHTGVMTTLGRAAMDTKSTTQKINTTSSCESELVALSKGLQQTIWSRFFLVSQGYKDTQITVYQDNKSTIKLIEKGRPAAEQSRHIDIGFFLGTRFDYAWYSTCCLLCYY
jgi:hypothetical protein